MSQGADGLPKVDALERYKEYLLLVARLRMEPSLRGKLDLNDMVQQTLDKAGERKEQFRGDADGEMAAWLRKILVRNLADAGQKHKRGQRSLNEALFESTGLLGDRDAADATSPSLQIDKDERLLQLADALAALPDDQRGALILRYIEGLAFSEVCRLIDEPAPDVAGLLRNGLKSLRDRLRRPESP